MVRISFTKHFVAGTLAGLSVPVSFVGDESRVIALEAAAERGEVRRDVLDRSAEFTITNVRAEALAA